MGRSTIAWKTKSKESDRDGNRILSWVFNPGQGPRVVKVSMGGPCRSVSFMGPGGKFGLINLNSRKYEIAVFH